MNSPIRFEKSFGLRDAELSYATPQVLPSFFQIITKSMRAIPQYFGPIIFIFFYFFIFYFLFFIFYFLFFIFIFYFLFLFSL